VAVLDPAPLYNIPPVKFRMANIAAGECSASECSLIGNDYWDAGYGRIVTVPRVKLAYDRVSDYVRPWVSFVDVFPISRKYMISFIHRDET
jgi:alpha-1,3-mannosyltransferase